MSEIPSEFFSNKSFKSLPQLAFLTWLIVLIVDAVVLQRFPYSFIRVLYVWGIGMGVSFLFELARYKNMVNSEKADYKKYFLLLNAFLIFLYASSYTGLTKQIGAWGELRTTINESGQKTKKSGLFLVAQEWAIPVLARQTSYFPDVTAIAENNELRAQNRMFRDSLAIRDKANNSNQVQDLIAKNTSLRQQNSSLTRSLIDCNNSRRQKRGPTSNNNDALVVENQRLTNENNQLKENNSLINTQIETLLQRINAFNLKQSEWAKITGKDHDSDIRVIITRATKDPSFFNFLFYTPISTK